MKKLIIFLTLFTCLFSISNNLLAQSAVVEASASGTDQDNTTATIVLAETINGGVPTSLFLTTTNSSSGCFSDYTYELLVNGNSILNGFCNFNNLNLSFFISDFSTVESVGLRAHDVASDGNPDVVDVNFSLAIEWVENSFEKSITAFDIPGATSSAVIDSDNQTVEISMPFDPEGVLLIPDFSLSLGASATVNGENQLSGISGVDFSDPVAYSIAAGDGTSEIWTVSVSNSLGISNDKNINSFSINGVPGIITDTSITIGFEVFEELSGLSPVFTMSSGAVAVSENSMQLSGITSLDFWEDVAYTIYGSNGTTKTYTVTVTTDSPCGLSVDFPLGNGLYNYAIDKSWSILGGSGNEIVTLDIMSFQIDSDDTFEIFEGEGTNGTLIASAGSDEIIGTYVSGLGFYIHFETLATSQGEGVEFDVSCVEAKHDFLSFSLEEFEEVAEIDLENQSIDIELDYGTDVNSLIANFELSPLSTVSINGIPQISGVSTNDFETAQVYTITDASGTDYNWIVTVNITPATVGKDVLSFSIDGQNGIIEGNTISLDLNSFADIEYLTPVFSLSPNATMSLNDVLQVSGETEHDYSNAQDYIVTAQDGSTKNYVVTVTKSTACEGYLDYPVGFSSYPKNEYKTFRKDAPQTGELLRLDFSNVSLALGDEFKVYEGADNSGVLLGTFTPGSTAGSFYTIEDIFIEFISDENLVSTGFELNTNCSVIGNDILSFTYLELDETPIIDSENKLISFEVEYGIDLSDLVASFEITTAAAITVNGVEQQSGINSHDFSSPIVYTVTDYIGNAVDWTVEVNYEAPTTEKDILNFNVEGIEAAVGENSIDLELSGFAPMSQLKPSFTLSTNATASIVGELQYSGVSSNDYNDPITYLITAQDGSTKTYTVNITKLDVCGEHLDYPLGSANYPADYVKAWELKKTNDEDVLVLDFTSFSLLENTYLKVYEGTNNTGNLIATYTGTAVPETLYSGLDLYLEFSSEIEAPLSTGFELDVTCILEDNQLLYFKLNSRYGVLNVDGIIDGNTVEAHLGSYSSLTYQKPIFETSPGSKLFVNGEEQFGGVTVQDFSSPVVYTVVTGSGETNDYTVTVTKDNVCGTSVYYINNYNPNNDLTGSESWVIAPDNENELVVLEVNNVSLEILDSAILYEGSSSSGINLGDLEDVDVVISKTPLFIDFKLYFFTGAIIDFNVTCETIDNSFVSFAFEEQLSPAVINTENHTINIEVLNTASIDEMAAIFDLSTGATVTLLGNEQESGVTQNDFSSPLVYSITDYDGVSQDWTVYVEQKFVTYYVSESGSGGQDGLSAANAAPYISSVIDLAFVGDSIKVMSGLVSENSNLIIPSGVLVYAMDGAVIDMNSFDLENNGHITLSASASLVQGMASSVSGTGTFEVIRKSDNNTAMFNFLSSPIDNINVQAVYGGSNVLSFAPGNYNNGINGWTYITSGTLNNAEGYIVSGSINPGFAGDRYYQGMVNNEDISIGLDGATYGSLFDGWNLIGNPYPSAIRMSDFITSNADVGAVTIYNQSLNTYQAYNTINVNDMEIASGQGFYIEFSESDNGVVEFNNSLRSLNGPGTIKKTSTIATSVLRISNNENYYDSYIAFTAAASDSYDHNYDARLLSGASTITLYSLLEDEAFAIQTLNSLVVEKTIGLGFEASPGLYTIDMIDFSNFSEDTQVSLIDHETGVEHNIKSEDYSFMVSDLGINETRFEIHYQQRRSDIESVFEDSTIHISLQDENLFVFGLESEKVRSLIIYDINGKQIMYLKDFEHTDKYVKTRLGILKTGIYFAEIKTDHQTEVLQLPILH